MVSFPRSKQNSLLTMYDLPSEEVGEPGLPDEFHPLQALLLRKTFQPRRYWPDRVLSAMDLNVYYDVQHPLWYKRPDWFGVVGVSRLYEEQDLRWSYVIWQEKVSPIIVVELLSPGTEAEDLGQTVRKANEPPTKWEVYEQILQVPYYVVYERYEHQFRAFHLERDRAHPTKPYRYQALALPDQRLWLQELELGLGVWQGNYESYDGLWLRFYQASGLWIPTSEEQAEQEKAAKEQQRQRAERQKKRANRLKQRAEQQQQRADLEQQRAEQQQQRADLEQQRADRAEEELQALRACLQERGIDPDTLL